MVTRSVVIAFSTATVKLFRIGTKVRRLNPGQGQSHVGSRASFVDFLLVGRGQALPPDSIGKRYTGGQQSALDNVG